MVKSDKDHALQLLAMAEGDHTALIHMLSKDDFPEEVFGFHAQQAIEKSLKAWISALGRTYPKTHDLSVLVGVLTDAGADLSPFPQLEDYTVFAVQYRYEGYDVGDEPLNRTAVLKETDRPLTSVRKVVGSVR